MLYFLTWFRFLPGLELVDDLIAELVAEHVDSGNCPYVQTTPATAKQNMRLIRRSGKCANWNRVRP